MCNHQFLVVVGSAIIGIFWAVVKKLVFEIVLFEINFEKFCQMKKSAGSLHILVLLSREVNYPIR